MHKCKYTNQFISEKTNLLKTKSPLNTEKNTILIHPPKPNLKSLKKLLNIERGKEVIPEIEKITTKLKKTVIVTNIMTINIRGTNMMKERKKTTVEVDTMTEPGGMIDHDQTAEIEIDQVETMTDDDQIVGTEIVGERIIIIKEGGLDQETEMIIGIDTEIIETREMTGIVGKELFT